MFNITSPAHLHARIVKMLRDQGVTSSSTRFTVAEYRTESQAKACLTVLDGQSWYGNQANITGVRKWFYIVTAPTSAGHVTQFLFPKRTEDPAQLATVMASLSALSQTVKDTVQVAMKATEEPSED